MNFIYYQKIITGVWSIRGSDERPSAKLAEGKRLQIRQETELPSLHRSLTLTELEKLYPLNQEH